MERALLPSFVADLQTGILQELRERILKDETLMLAIRSNYINVYYRGGNLLKLTEKCEHSYEPYFDVKYGNDIAEICNALPSNINENGDIKKWIDQFSMLKQSMDFWLAKHPKQEREFQQLVVRENNYSSIANDTDYFITDIETADSTIGARFDMIAVKWISTQQERKQDNVSLALVEMKYADNALEGKSGIADHIQQWKACLGDAKARKAICSMAQIQMNQLNALGFVNHTRKENRKFVVSDDSIEVIFICANHKPRSSVLLRELEAVADTLNNAEREGIFKPRFFIANTAGYGMYDSCMVGTEEYINFLRKQK